MRDAIPTEIVTHSPPGIPSLKFTAGSRCTETQEQRVWRCSCYTEAFSRFDGLQRVCKPDQGGGLLGREYSASVVVNVCDECVDQRRLLPVVFIADGVLD